jgi:hypothetical protein
MEIFVADKYAQPRIDGGCSSVGMAFLIKTNKY